MNLFLDTVSPKNALILFDEKREIRERHFFDVRQNESTLLIEELDKFLKQNNLNYHNLENIVVVNGPGSFTGIRTTILLVNTINFVNKKDLTAINYFKLFDNFPIVKTSSKRDSFVKFQENKEIEIIENKKLIEKLKNYDTIYGDGIFLKNKNIYSEVDYKKIIKNISLEKNKIVSPFYLKKPSIS